MQGGLAGQPFRAEQILYLLLQRIQSVFTPLFGQTRGG